MEFTIFFHRNWQRGNLTGGGERNESDKSNSERFNGGAAQAFHSNETKRTGTQYTRGGKDQFPPQALYGNVQKA